MTKEKRLIDYLNSMSDDEIVALHNAYCEAIDDMDSCIYSTQYLDKVLERRTPTDILCMGFYGNFNPRDRFFWINSDGDLESVGYAVDAPIYVHAIAVYAVAAGDSLGNDKIQEILDDEDELQALAAKIHAAKTWVEVEDELKALCEAAGMEDEYKAADGDSFEAVIYKAAERLGVEI